MKRGLQAAEISVGRLLTRLGIKMRAKLIIIFVVVKVIPLILLTAIAWQQINLLGSELKNIAVEDSSNALDDSAVENIERLSTDTAKRVADFLYGRDSDILYLATLPPNEESYARFCERKQGRLVRQEGWRLADDGASWIPTRIDTTTPVGGVSTNPENNDMNGFHYRAPDQMQYDLVPLYDEITFVDLEGQEQFKYTSLQSPKVNYPLHKEKRNVSLRQNTYVNAETYFEKLAALAPGEIYVSDVTGAYIGSNYIGMYTPQTVDKAAKERGYDIDYQPEEQAYAGMENPLGQRFEGIVRWATPVSDNTGKKIGYVTFALNHDHIMEFVDYITPMNERYTPLPSAYDGNYAFIWDYKCRSICHPRHHSIVGFDPETGDPQTPWLESSIYQNWQASGVEKWTDFVEDLPIFSAQSREKKPASALTQAGLVGLDGRYLNNAPQCTGWMDLTANGGSGSFYILWSGLYKLNTAAAIPYYTGQYAPSAENGYSKRGFGFVAIGAGLEDFTRPARETEKKLSSAIEANLGDTSMKLFVTTCTIIALVVLIAIWMASSLTGSITRLNKGISRFREGERQFRFRAPVKDEFGILADSFDDMADSLVDSVNNPLCITNSNRIVKYMNQRALEFCRMTLENIVGTFYADSSVYPANSEYCPITALESGVEPKIYYDPASQRHLRGTASYLLNKSGQKIGYIVESVDMTEIVFEQIRLKDQRTLLDKIFSESPDLIWYQNVRGEYLAVNPRFASISGKSTEEFLGKTALQTLPAAIAQAFAVCDQQTVASSEPLYTEECIAFADGHEEMLDSVRTPIYEPDGTPAGLLGFARNVSVRVDIESKLRATQLELEQAVNNANRANEHKGEFLARMSHEIRTPMNAIIGITSIVLKKLEEINAPTSLEDVRGNVRQIEASSQHLLGLLNDILDLSKIEAGKIELSDEAVDLSRLADTVATMIRPRCDEKHIEFLTHVDSFAATAFLTDSLRLRQVLINLLGNAVKFTPECGRVEFHMHKKESRYGQTLVEFIVQDTGIGISGAAQEDIFQPFEQGGGGISRKYGGTGLGLAISRRIVQLLGGNIELSSKLGEGSAFRFSLWLTETADHLPSETSVSDFTGKFTGKRALLVDDVEINRMIVLSMLEDAGILIDEADDGQVAVRMFSESAPGDYDLIFMDVLMPHMDGYEAASTIRAMDRADAKTIPIVAITANAFKEDIDKAINNGMNAHIAKPLQLDKLLEILFRYLKPGE